MGHSSPIQLQTHVTYLRQIVPSLLKDEEVKKNKTKHSIVVFVLGSVQGRIISSIFLCVYMSGEAVNI